MGWFDRPLDIWGGAIGWLEMIEKISQGAARRYAPSTMASNTIIITKRSQAWRIVRVVVCDR